MSETLAVHRHGGGGFELPLPVGWEWRENVEGCALLAIEPERDDEHLRANVVVTVERLPQAEILDEWSDRSLAALEASLNRHRLLDFVRPDLCTLELSYGGKAMRGWISYSPAALLLPEAEDDGGRRALLALHPTVLPAALAELVDLGPRPVAEGASPVVLVEDAIPDVVRRWRLGAAWRLDDGTEGGDGLEVLDSAGGLWLVTTGEEGGRAIAWPVTPTLGWRHIVRIVMRRAADETRATTS